MTKDIEELFAGINTFFFDVDGVLSDGSLIMLGTGEALRKMNIRDGYAMQHAIKKGYRIAIITGGRSEIVKLRFNRLGITDVFLGVEDKIVIFDELVTTYNLDPIKILYMGDDLPDFKVMHKAGLPCCPADAAEEIKEISKYISPVKGGNGCARDVIEKTMKIHGKWLDNGAFEW